MKDSAHSRLGTLIDFLTRPSYLGDAQHGGPGRSLAAKFLFVVAGVAVLVAVVLQPLGSSGPDFDPIWNAVTKYLSGQPVYDEDYSTQDPHYLYSPGGTLLISPLGWLPGRDLARWVMLLAGAGCILLAMYLLSRAVAGPGRRALVVCAGFVTVTFFFAEPVRSTLKYTNINGFLLLLQVIFILATVSLLRARQASDEPLVPWMVSSLKRPDTLVAAVVLSVALSIKPQFVALAVLSVLTFQWAVLLVAGLLFCLYFALGYATMARPGDYFERLLPYIGEPRDYNNGSLDGMGLQLGWNPELVLGLKVVLMLVTLGAVWALFAWRHHDPFFWAATSASVLFCGLLMCSGLVQGYYCIWLFPLLITVLRPSSPMHSVWMWLAYFCLVFAFEVPEDWGVIHSVLRWQASIAWMFIPTFVLGWALKNRPSQARVAHSQAAHSQAQRS
ncbi:DUF2029 domain-containing protein [Corynebacterium sp. zg254]|uniref:DUF2029 domain-containing protein n=1 Tax=Corynebacterium zhongnanshanii TaxID=2768834 RepID=A0ABQ6VC29_9CORY|nr:DUF2029 domain-containing protein [Corynebacterium zhongnanshanii]MCR5915113.1 DUF2029 domain-containing protein [Corynebacterium sp. zg254]